ncbi:TolB domain-containing protein [Psychrobacillus soli]|uniref:TolB domain-containing protein n=1 Tax=Psychrobacillus soli TaxID=1543965 RepID=A0A544TDY1_9BACI|nr:TolB domain-containing protein [Psychrobacillus soli]TQR15645.1 TolB domain-containing protein [Psychrobacillus soli]
MAKILQLLIIFCLLSPSIIRAETDTSSVKVAFERDGYLWIKANNKEMKIMNEKATYNYPPEWSFDGKMILYQKEVPGNLIDSKNTSNELWVYTIQTKTHKKIFYDGYSPKWSPTANIVAFMDGGVLNVSNLQEFNNIALGVDSYEWQPSGKGFIASSGADLRPDGWTNPVLYKIALADNYMDNKDLTKNVKKLFVIPKEIGTEEVKIISINANSFHYSPNGQWVSFRVSPTASWAMDSDMLCVLSADGKQFNVIDEMALGFDSKWAFNRNYLGYIAGGGRIVYGFKNKDLKVTELPSFLTLDLTPEKYVDMGFSWMNDDSFVVSRVPETEWSNDPEKRPQPSLYFVPLSGNEQVRITTPPKEKGDYNPIYLPPINKITWSRQKELPDNTAELWIADPNGGDAKVWINNIGVYSFFPKK